MAITLTFGDVAENHVGMMKCGDKAEKGLSISQLQEAQTLFESQGLVCQLLDLVELSGIEKIHNPEPAALLIIRGGVNALLENATGADLLLEEQSVFEPDKKALMRGRVVNKLARHNLCFSDVASEPDYSQGQGRVISFDQVPLLNRIRIRLPEYFGTQAMQLQAEGNYYYDISKCGIGFHGDGERRIVIAIRLGESIPLHYQWFYRHNEIGRRIIVPPLEHGDIYVMSGKATGTDWKRSTVLTLRHAAGSAKWLAAKAT